MSITDILNTNSEELHKKILNYINDNKLDPFDLSSYINNETLKYTCASTCIPDPTNTYIRKKVDLSKIAPCKSGFRDDGSNCVKDSYGRGVGYIPKVVCPSGYDAVGVGAASICKKKGWSLSTKSSEMQCKDGDEYFKTTGLCYPKCRDGYHNFGCCICQPDKDEKEDVAKRCPEGMDLTGGSCYEKCKDGYKSYVLDSTCSKSFRTCGGLGGGFSLGTVSGLNKFTLKLTKNDCVGKIHNIGFTTTLNLKHTGGKAWVYQPVYTIPCNDKDRPSENKLEANFPELILEVKIDTLLSIPSMILYEEQIYDLDNGKINFNFEILKLVFAGSSIDEKTPVIGSVLNSVKKSLSNLVTDKVKNQFLSEYISPLIMSLLKKKLPDITSNCPPYTKPPKKVVTFAPSTKPFERGVYIYLSPLENIKSIDTFSFAPLLRSGKVIPLLFVKDSNLQASKNSLVAILIQKLDLYNIAETKKCTETICQWSSIDNKETTLHKYDSNKGLSYYIGWYQDNNIINSYDSISNLTNIYFNSYKPEDLILGNKYIFYYEGQRNYSINATFKNKI